MLCSLKDFGKKQCELRVLSVMRMSVIDGEQQRRLLCAVGDEDDGEQQCGLLCAVGDEDNGEQQ